MAEQLQKLADAAPIKPSMVEDLSGLSKKLLAHKSQLLDSQVETTDEERQMLLQAVMTSNPSMDREAAVQFVEEITQHRNNAANDPEMAKLLLKSDHEYLVKVLEKFYPVKAAEGAAPSEEKFMYKRGKMDNALWSTTQSQLRTLGIPCPEPASFSEAWKFGQELFRAQMRGDFTPPQMQEQFVAYLDDFKWQAYDRVQQSQAELLVRNPQDRRAVEIFQSRLLGAEKTPPSPPKSSTSPRVLTILESLSHAQRSAAPSRVQPTLLDEDDEQSNKKVN